jgi:hypothetical protein
VVPAGEWLSALTVFLLAVGFVVVAVKQPVSRSITNG